MTSAAGPAFSQVIHAEIARYGFAGATLMALIRYRCQTDGPDRVVVDGVRYWRVSYGDIAKLLGVSKDMVRGGLAKCGSAITANQIAPFDDRKKAYHVPPYDEALTSRWESDHTPDQQVGISPPHVGNSPHPVVKIPHPVVDSPHVPLSVEGEEGGEAAGSRQAAAPPTSSSQTANGKPTFHPRCADHIHDEFPPKCHGCGEARRAAEASARTAEEREAERRGQIRDAIDACQDCDPWGRLDDLSDCPQHLNFRVIAMSA
ncbi:hypothetical protein [Mycolicibacterium bacteremicum]|uniref:hypothetical protein n=1 Tax=Mycolicibacterium bacteremicum TaxID=564198 RepID=UPI0026EAE595|nr:hypothetical protein [Mycolicibacterium bacteremicum]